MPAKQEFQWNRTLLGFGIAMAAAAWAASASAADRAECGEFTVYSDGSMRNVTYVDIEPKGTSIGDQRIGRRGLSDGDGNRIGDLRWIATIHEVGNDDGAETLMSSSGTFTFPEGSIFIKRLPDPVTAGPEVVNEVIGRNDLAVVGGSDSFAGARGHVTRNIDGVGTTFIFDIDCG